MDKYQKQIISYADNRKRLSDINCLISNMTYFDNETGDFLSIDQYRIDFFGQDEYGNIYERWQGWVYCLEFIGEYEDEEMELAIQYDKRKQIMREAGQIKRNICTMGRALIKSINKSESN